MLNKKRLVAFGCSNAFGHGLKDCIIPPGDPGPDPSKLAWPSLLADKLRRECVNLSDPGYSNKAIWKRVVTFRYLPDDLVVVGWTVPERWCVIKDHIDLAEADHIGSWSRSKIAKSFYKQFYNKVDVNIDMNLRIHHASLYLNSIGVENFHTIDYASDLEKLEWNTTPIMKTYFLPISNKFPKALDGEHPGPDAHQEYAKELYEEILEKQ